MINGSRRLATIVVALAACLVLAGCGGNAPYSPIISDTGQAADFVLLADTTSVTVEQGAVAEFPLVLKAVGSFSSTVQMAVSGLTGRWTLLPSDSLVPSTAGTPMTLKVNSAGLVPGGYTLTVSGHAGELTRTVVLTLKVTGLSLDIIPSSRDLTLGGTAEYTVTITPLNGHTGAANLSVTGLPGGVSASLSPPTVQLSGGTPQQSLLTLETDRPVGPAASRVSGDGHTFTVTAQSGAATASATATVVLITDGGIDAIIR